METKEIIESLAFKTINMLIDRKVLEIKDELEYIKLAFEDSFTPSRDYQFVVRIRLHEEEGEESEVIPFSLSTLKTVIRRIQTIDKAEEQINELQRFKCRLLNDWDFTRGDNAEQAELFEVPHKTY